MYDRCMWERVDTLPWIVTPILGGYDSLEVWGDRGDFCGLVLWALSDATS